MKEVISKSVHKRKHKSAVNFFSTPELKAPGEHLV